MGGFFHLFYFNRGRMARKIHKHKRHDDGLEAPRNSLELQVETSQSYNAMGDMLYSYQVDEDWPGKNYYPVEASIKKLINEEISQQPKTRQNAPSIVARLMGMDTLPVDTKSVVQPAEEKNNKLRVKHSGKNGRSTTPQLMSNSNNSRQMELDLIYGSEDRDADRLSTGQNYGRPRPREHPQEEELQKFKKEFEAWQAARLRECSNIVGLGSIGKQGLPEKKSNKEKITTYANFGEKMSDKPIEPDGFILKASSHERSGLHHNRHKTEHFQDDQKKWFSSRSRSMSADFEQSSMMDYDGKLDTAPTRIIILKPGPDRFYDHEESLTSSSGTLEERGSIESFLEEVKERLKLELQAKTLKKSALVRGSGIETPFSEKPSDSKQIARDITKQVKENVSREIGTNLLRSESTRSYRSESQFKGPGSPDYINGDKRRFLSERLRNVLKQETHLDAPICAGGSSRSSMFDNGSNIKQMQETIKFGNEKSCWEIVRDEQEMQTRSFRHGNDNGVLLREVSPRNLIRSLSAPVSGTSFGKLLLEDRHVITGAQIRRKHEGIDNVSVDVRKRKKERFNFKEKVSSIRYSFTLPRRLFGKKIQSMVKSQNAENNLLKDIMSGPTVIMNFTEIHENSTEVPPSPASVCSSTHEEIWRQVDHLSPISTPDTTTGEENAIAQVFKEISSNLNELQRQLHELESDSREERTVEEEPIESETMDIEDEAESYIRDLLVASGLYDGKSDKLFSRWDPLAKPISNTVFEQVEESYRKLSKEIESNAIDHNEKKVDVDHRVLLDLLNEALLTVLGPSVTMSKFRRKLISSSTSPAPCRKKLLDSVWKIVHVYLHPPTDRSNYTIDGMVAQDLESTPWSGLMDDETNVLATEVACHILEDLVEETTKHMHL
ncbi:hypothetical protein SLE2022_008880 [Rubroshorea leprosula]